jgi:putative ABC transport system permease protein
MVEDFRERLRDRAVHGWRACVWLVLRTVADVLVTALSEWVQPAERSVSGERYGVRAGFASRVRLDAVRLDLRFAVRTLARRRGFTAVVVLTLALGVGATTAIFTAVNAVLLRPPPVGDAERLVVVWESSAEKGWVREFASPANIADWGDQVAAFRDITGYGVAVATITDEASPEVVPAAFVMGNFFDVVGVSAAHGRTLRADEMWSDAARVVVLSDGLWARRFGSDPGVVGSVLMVDEIAHEVVGIMPPGFAFPDGGVDVYLPLGWERAARRQLWFRDERILRAIARLQDGVSVASADAQLQVVVERLRSEYPLANGTMGAGITLLHEFVTSESRAPLLILLGASALVLLLTCANVANLLLARATGREQEMALRTALGAGRARIAGQLVAESAVLALISGAAGVAVAMIGIRALHVLRPPDEFPLDGLAIDGRVLLFALVVTAVTGLAFGLVPILKGAASRTTGALQEGLRSTAGRSRRRASQALVVAEIALALLLVAAAGLMLRSFVALREVDPGFRVEDRVTASLVLPRRYASDDGVMTFADEFVARVERIRGVEAVTYASRLPFAGATTATGGLRVQGREQVRYGEAVGQRLVAANWFQVLGVPLLDGRSFDEADGRSNERVVVINERMARHFFPDGDAVGQRITGDEKPDADTEWNRVIGVVGNEHQNGVRTPPLMEMFTLYRQLPSRRLSFIVHTRTDLPALTDALRRELAEVDPQLPFGAIRPLEDIYAGLLGRDRFLLALIGAFATLALALATVGVYGLMAENVARRTREIGVRVALGAASRDVARMILLQGMKLAGLGVIIGLAAALATARLLNAVLFGVAPTDGVTFLGVTAILTLTAAVACAVPAVRASRLEPTAALRHD